MVKTRGSNNFQFKNVEAFKYDVQKYLQQLKQKNYLDLKRKQL